MNDTPEFFPTSASSRDKPPGKIGGCVGTFLQFFDWNPRKRLFSTKRLPAERPNARKAAPTTAKKKYKDERMPVAKLLLLADEENRGGFPSPKKASSVSSADHVSEDGAIGKRVPGIVARLMGLESLPDERTNDGKLSPQHPKLSPSLEVRPLQELLHTRAEPVLLSDLLREREYLEAQKHSVKDKLQVPVPGFVKKFPEGGGGLNMNYMPPPKDGFKKTAIRGEPHLQPYTDQKYNKSLRPLKRTSRDLADPKHLILALSPRAGGDGMRPILLPSKAHNKLMNSPVKSPTKMGSRSARLLEAAVKILEPNMQPMTARPRVPPARPSSVREFRDSEREAGVTEERRERPVMVDKKVPASSNAARALKGQSMSRSWNGREEATLRYNSGSIHDSGGGRRRNDHYQMPHSRTASPLRVTSRSRTNSRGISPQEEMNLRNLEDIKTIVPQGFEETYGEGLKPLNVGRRDEEVRLEKYEMEDRKVTEKHVVSSLSSLSSLSVGNSPYSECSDRSTTSSFHDPLRRSGSVKEGGLPAAHTASKSRFMRSKSVTEEKSSKLGGGGGAGAQGPHHTRISAREVRVKQEIPPQAHQVHMQAFQQTQQLSQLPEHECHQLAGHMDQQAHGYEHHEDHEQQVQHESDVETAQQSLDGSHNKFHLEDLQQASKDFDLRAYEESHQAREDPHTVDLQDSVNLQSPPPAMEATSANQVSPNPEDEEVGPADGGSLKSGSVVVPIEEKTVDTTTAVQGQGVPMVHQAGSRMSSQEVAMSADESFSSGSSHPSAGSHASSLASTKDGSLPRSNNGGGLLSYKYLFGGRKSGERKGESKEKNRGRDASRKSESSLVRTLLRRKPTPQSASSPSPAPVQSMDKPKKRGGRKYSVTGPSSRDGSDSEPAGYYSEGSPANGNFDMAAVIQANKFEDKGELCKERVIHPDDERTTYDSPVKAVDEVFPDVLPPTIDKGCLRLLDELDDRGSQRIVIEGFDCVNDDDEEDRFREGILSYAAHLMDDLKLEEMFSTGTVMQGSGRNGFSYSPLVELEEPARYSLDSYLDIGAEVEKCVSFLGRTGGVSSSPERNFSPRELLPEDVVGNDDDVKPGQEQQQPLTPKEGLVEEPTTAAVEDAKDKLLNELSDARKIVDNAFEEATERVAKKLASKERVTLAGVDGTEEAAVCASAASTDDCGQPSPVSVLDCSFEEDESRSSQGNLHESTCEAEVDEFDEVDEEALIDDLLLKSATSRLTGRGKKARIKVPLTPSADLGANGKTQSEKLVDAFFDISRIRSIDPSDRGLMLENSEPCPEEDEDYVRTILSNWEVLPAASRNGTAANSELPITSTLFDRLESQGRASAWQRDKQKQELSSTGGTEGSPVRRSLKQWQGLWLHRRLLFDCLNETLAYRLNFKYPDPWIGVPVLRTPPTGGALVKEVYSDMNDWRQMQAEELDTVIETDMGTGSGNWSNLNQEIGEIGLEIEQTLLRVMIEELVSEILAGADIATADCPVVLRGCS